MQSKAHREGGNCGDRPDCCWRRALPCTQQWQLYLLARVTYQLTLRELVPVEHWAELEARLREQGHHSALALVRTDPLAGQRPGIGEMVA